MRYKVSSVFFLLSIFLLPAQSSAAEFHPVVSIGYDSGGDTVLDYTVVKINDRTVNRDDKITAGNGLTLSVGAYMPLLSNIGIQATVGLKIDSATFVDAYIAFSRNPIDLLAIYHLGEHHSFAGGVTYHSGVNFTLESSTQNQKINLDDTVGAIAEYTYAVRDSRDGGLKLGLRYTAINYAEPISNTNTDGSSIGIMLYLY